jgi:hypothetical protein
LYRLGSFLRLYGHFWPSLRPYAARSGFVGGRARRSQIDAADGCQGFRGLSQVASLHAAHKLEDVAFGAAAEAVKALLLRRYLQRRLRVVVEGAQHGELIAGTGAYFEIVVPEHLQIGVLFHECKVNELLPLHVEISCVIDRSTTACTCDFAQLSAVHFYIVLWCLVLLVRPDG